MTEKILWTLLVPSSGLEKGPALEVWRRRCTINCEYEKDDGDTGTIRLLFQDVQAFKCTYLFGVEAEFITLAYDKVVDVGESDWLKTLKENVASYPDTSPEELRHLIIFFDDGPGYEFVCRSFEAEIT